MSEMCHAIFLTYSPLDSEKIRPKEFYRRMLESKHFVSQYVTLIGYGENGDHEHLHSLLIVKCRPDNFRRHMKNKIRKDLPVVALKVERPRSYNATLMYIKKHEEEIKAPLVLYGQGELDQCVTRRSKLTPIKQIDLCQLLIERTTGWKEMCATAYADKEFELGYSKFKSFIDEIAADGFYVYAHCNKFEDMYQQVCAQLGLVKFGLDKRNWC